MDLLFTAACSIMIESGAFLGQILRSYRPTKGIIVFSQMEHVGIICSAVFALNYSYVHRFSVLEALTTLSPLLLNLTTFVPLILSVRMFNYSRRKDVPLRPSQHWVNRAKCFPVSRPSFFVLAGRLARPSRLVPSILRWSRHSTE